jgi:hypothetical protein
MVYRKKRGKETIPGVAPCIAARIAPDWRYIHTRGGFQHLKSEKFHPIKGLPPSTRTQARYPDLVGMEPDSMTDDEKELSHYIEFVFHSRAKLDEHLKRIEDWAPIMSAYIVPTPDLPFASGDKR